jgi:diguanylate cyclase (GGDEF)-like protein/PAS domain S-box-containing protein/putative nucleotidyltransferase with HDIG domain
MMIVGDSLNVLLVEDVPSDAMLVERIVKKTFSGSRFLCVDCREDFMGALQEFQPGIILSDYNLPRFDGLTALSLAVDAAPETPFIIVTGSINEETAVECIKAGAWDYVLKEHLMRLGSAINKALEQRRLRQERQSALTKLYESEERYRSIFQMAPAAIVVYSEGVFRMINPAGLKLFGASSPEELIGSPISRILNQAALEKTGSRLDRLLDGEPGIYPAEDIVTKLDGTPVDVEIMVSPLMYGSSKAFQVMITDISRRKRAEQERAKLNEINQYLSYHDHLTDLYNRRFFENQLKKMNDENILPLTIIMGDVNGLKLINDSFGHEAGDELLVKAANVIRKGCRETDIVARIGGDEFGIILPGTDESSAEKIIQRIKEEASAIDFDNTLLSISFGYSTKYSADRKVEELMMEAENYMYRRKMYESASMRNKTIDVIMNALYEKSDRELRHSRRVSALSADIAEKLGFGPDEVNKIRMAGLVHDIGKIGISEKILNKPGKLDNDEYAKIKKHPEAGWRILSSAREFSDLAKEILYHHERWDGRGYPAGLTGADIPVEARIIAVADAYDAMTSARPYRDTLKKQDALAELQKSSGTQFDPDIVAVFLEKVLQGIKD